MEDESSDDLPPSPNDNFNRKGEADLNRMRMAETDRRYVKFKMKQIKKEKQAGNPSIAERHRVELLKYLGML